MWSSSLYANIYCEHADLAEWTQITEQLTAAEVGADRINTHVLLRKPKVFVGYPVRGR